MLTAAANPCPCGRGEDDERCRCTPLAVRRYETKLTGALADRIDIWKGLAQPGAEAMGGAAGERSEVVRERVCAARRRQTERLGRGRCNADLAPAELRRLPIERRARELLAGRHPVLGLSGRGHDRVLRVARTVADLAGSEPICTEHMEEALGLRRPG
jgi:magnesium chelatase family protein